MEKFIVMVNEKFFKEHLDIFHHAECKVLKSVISDDLFKDDEIHQDLVKIRRRADQALMNYEYDKRNQ